MAAKGSEAKQHILNKIKEAFPEMFSPDGKEWRIPIMENGEQLQIKVALTCAKDLVASGNVPKVASAEVPDFPTITATAQIELTEEEKNRIADVVEKMKSIF